VAEALPEDAGGVPPIAAAWKAANWVPGFTAKTMPALQWVPCLQYTQTGVVSLIVSSATGNPSVTESATGKYPESKPAGAGEHGAANVDWVAVWFFC